MYNELKTLTSARVSSATKSVGGDMYDAVQKFDVLPPEYRGEATRKLFYATQGQMATLSPEAYQQLTVTSAQKVIDDINAERRQTAVKALTQPQQELKDEANKEIQDNAFLKKIQTSPEEVQQFARSKNVPVNRVMDALRKKYPQ